MSGGRVRGRARLSAGERPEWRARRGRPTRGEPLVRGAGPASLERYLLDPTLIALAVVFALLLALSQQNYHYYLGAGLALGLLAIAAKAWAAAAPFRRAARRATSSVRVLREGGVETVPSRKIVAGDRVVLEPGLRAPAPLRVLSSEGLRLANGTGANGKGANGKGANANGQGETISQGSWVLAGHGIAEALPRGRAREAAPAAAPGPHADTEADAPRPAAETSPPILGRLARTGLLLAIPAGMLALPVPIYLIAVGALSASDGALLAVALFALMLPPGLVAGAGLVLAGGARRLLGLGVLPFHARAVEGLGRASFLCVNSADVLQSDAPAVRRAVLPGGETIALPEGVETGARPIDAPRPALEALAGLAVAAVAAGASRADPASPGFAPEGDRDARPAERLAAALGLDRAQIPAAAVLAVSEEGGAALAAGLLPGGDGTATLCLRGPAAAVLAHCTAMRGPSGLVALDGAAMEAAARGLEEEGLRAVAVAVSEPLPEGTTEAEGFALLGLLGVADGFADGTIEAAEEARSGRLRLAVIDDRPRSVARIDGVRLSLVAPHEQVVTGADLAAAAPRAEGALDNLVRPARVFGETGRAQAAFVVDSFRRDNHTVCAVGRRPEDLPAMRAANLAAAIPGPGADAVLAEADLALRTGTLAEIADAVAVSRAALERVSGKVACAGTIGLGVLLLLFAVLVLKPTFPLLPEALFVLAIAIGVTIDLAFAGEAEEGDELARPVRRSVSRLLSLETAVLSLSGAAAGAAVLLGVLLLAERQAVRIDEVRGSMAVAVALFAAIQGLGARRDWSGPLSADYWRNGTAIAWAAALVLGAWALGAVPVTAFYLGLGPVPLEMAPVLAGAAAALFAVQELLRRRRLSARKRLLVSRRERG